MRSEPRNKCRGAGYNELAACTAGFGASGSSSVMKKFLLLLCIALLGLLSGCGTMHGSVQKTSGSPVSFGLMQSIPLGK